MLNPFITPSVCQGQDIWADILVQLQKPAAQISAALSYLESYCSMDESTSRKFLKKERKRARPCDKSHTPIVSRMECIES
mmetsp:Transcript_28856/g.85214  ORF Transcript_28856/g.85214 Transcript_28856/m.85214 type:complete len:80 (-) Transcript_28856:1720-1959(-)